jgi:uncharacterized protein
VDKPWYQRLFSPDRKSDPQTTQVRADHGDAEAQFDLGLTFANGAGDAQDYVQAAEWYRKAADQNHSPAQFNLGLLYAQGQGVARNEDEAVLWIRRSAEQGNAGAQFDLGRRYYRASVSGSEMDSVESRIEAYKWFQLAMAQGYNGAASACEPMTLRMSREDVVKGNDRIATFVATHRTSTHEANQ